MSTTNVYFRKKTNGPKVSSRLADEELLKAVSMVLAASSLTPAERFDLERIQHKWILRLSEDASRKG